MPIKVTNVNDGLKIKIDSDYNTTSLFSGSKKRYITLNTGSAVPMATQNTYGVIRGSDSIIIENGKVKIAPSVLENIFGAAAQEWVIDQGYATSADLNAMLVPYATKEWVEDNFSSGIGDPSNYATKSWVENSATAYNAARLGGYSATSYPRKAENAVVAGSWQFNVIPKVRGTAPGIEFWQTDNENVARWVLDGNNLETQIVNYDTGALISSPIKLNVNAPSNSMIINSNGNLGVGVDATERLHVAGNGLFTGNIIAEGNVGTSNFVSRMLGWRVTPQGQADFRHIYTDELQAKAFTADISQALVGSDILTKSVAKLAQNFKIGANDTYAYLYVEELEGYPGMSVFSVGDKLRLRVFDRSGGGLIIADVWVTVTDHDISDTVNNVQKYTVRFDDDGGVVGSDVYAGSMILDYGQSGSGVIERTVLDQQGSPYSRVSTWTGSPDNPENYTLHYQSGNLNGIANAEGWGVYSENSFLTGKLLVGDLTKAGQYMEYKDGELSIKGQITVTGGNAATKADVDAVQIGGRNLILNSSFARGYDNWGTSGGSGQTIATGASDYPSTSSVKRSAKWTNTADAGQGITALTTDSWPLLENGKEYVITCWVKASSASTFSLQVHGDSGDVVDSFKTFSVNTNWQKIVHIITGDGQSNPQVRFRGRNNGVTYWVNCPKVEIGNKATDWTPAPEDMDAAIDNIEVGGRNLLKNTASGVGWSKTDFDTETRTFTRETTGTSELFVALIGQTRLENNTTYTLSAWIKSNGQVKDVDYYVYDKSISKVHSKQGIAVTTDWQLVTFTFTTDSSTDYSESTVRFDNNGSKTAGVNAILYVKEPQLERGNKATDWTPAPEDVPSALDYLATAIQDGSTEIEGGLINTNVLMVKDTNGAVRGGISGLASDNIGFWTGGTYQAAISNDANVIFRKDGSFSLAGGKITGTSAGELSVDGSVVTGIIESSNYDGIVGSRFDLYNGHLQIGDAIRMSGDVSEIQVRNRDTDLDSFRVGDFPLSPLDFSGEGVDVYYSSTSVSVSPSAGSYQLNKTVYLTEWLGWGYIVSTPDYINTESFLIVGGTYSFATQLKVTLSSYQQVDTAFGVNLNKFEYIGGNGIKVQLENGNTVVWQQTIFSIPEDGVIPLIISTTFQAVSEHLQLTITIDGEYRRFVPDGPNTRISNTSATISRFDSSSKLVLKAEINRMEFSTKGMQTIFSNTNYFRCDNTGIEGRGIQTFISPNGTYRLRISNDGIEKSTNGGTTWTTL